MQQKTVSTMQPLTGASAGAAASLIISRLSVPTIQRIDGYMNGVDTSTQYWLMFFAGTTVPANATQPLFALQVVGKNGFSWDFGSQGGLDFTKMSSLFAGTLGLIVAVSSTASTLTASAATMDIEVTVNEPFLPIAGLSVAGDITTGRLYLDVWSQASGPKSIYSGQMKNNSGATQYLMLFSDEGANVADGTIPLMTFTLLNGVTLPFDFGTSGFSPKTIVAGVELHACSLIISTTSATLTAISSGVSPIRAFYK